MDWVKHSIYLKDSEWYIDMVIWVTVSKKLVATFTYVAIGEINCSIAVRTLQTRNLMLFYDVKKLLLLHGHVLLSADHITKHKSKSAHMQNKNLYIYIYIYIYNI